VERVQGDNLNPVAEVPAPLVEPVAVGPVRAAGYEVQQPSPQPPAWVRNLGHVVPHVLIQPQPQPRDAGEPRLVLGHALQ
jgi:hypothetical protein